MKKVRLYVKRLGAKGHEAYSADILDCSGGHPEWHIKGDVLDILDDGFDMMIAHPPCTRLCNSGVRWLHERSLWDELQEGAEFFNKFLYANIPLIAVENPVMHKYAVEIEGRRQNFTMQPYEHGSPFTKRTCWWTKGLPDILPTNIISERYPAVHYASPGPDRAKERSKTDQGIANALALKWG